MGHLSMIVFQKCVVMPTIVGGYWGALLTLRLISWKRKTWLFQPNNKIKISVQQIIFINFGKSLKNAPLMNIPSSPSLVPSTPKVTGCHRIYARYISLSSIHSVCIMLFILSPLIRWSYIKCCALLRVFLLTTNWQLSLNDFASTLLHHHDLNIMPFSYWMKKLFFLNIQPFSLTRMKLYGDNTFVLRFSTLIRSTMHLRILRIRSDLQTRKYSVSFRI